MTTTLLFSDAASLGHDPGPAHPESPARFAAIQAALATLPTGVSWHAVRAATEDELLRVHTTKHVAALEQLAGQRMQLDPDTSVSPGSHLAAIRAAGAGTGMVDALLDGEASSAFALVRPPGHHAESGAPMGFCLFNNIAIAAAHARARGVERVAIVDWDVHHGNGTQHIFEDRRDVLFISSHQFPFYPGTGDAAEVGAGDGAGFTVNLPLPPGMRDGDYGAAFRDLVGPLLAEYRPGLVLVSAGFDAHARDPLASMQLSEDGFGALCTVVRDAAKQVDAPLGLMLEGGYHLEALAGSVRRCVEVLAGESVALKTDASTAGAAALARTRAQARKFWKL